MLSTTPGAANAAPVSLTARRVVAVDLFRGFVVLVMIFVNDVAGVHGLPRWTYHMPPGVNGMTYVDMVFPFFLFILGMVIPLALERRLAKGEPAWRTAGHVAVRSLALVVMGTLLANGERISPALTGMNETAWRLLAFAGVLLLWNAYPKDGRQGLYRVLRYVGFVLLAAMLIIFRRVTRQGEPGWLDFHYLEILGLLGCTYLATALLYLALRKRPRLFPVLLALLVALNARAVIGWPASLGAWLRYWPFEAGLCLIAVAGLVASMVFFKRERDFAWKARMAVVYAALLFVAGLIVVPLGISKNRATPAWGLFSAGAAVLLFLALYWIADIKKKTRWAAFVHPAGANTLTTYLLPWIWDAIPPLAALGGYWSAGLPGAVKALVFTALMLALAWVLTRMKLRMQL